MNTHQTTDLAAYVAAAAARGDLVVQPRMGMPEPDRMAAGLRAVAGAPATTVGTITLDSYTRVGDHDGARRALEQGAQLNGFPLVAHGPRVTARVAGAAGDLPVQVRHGSAAPEDIFATMVQAGLTTSEGGPVSYCLPYGRVPLAESVRHWSDATDLLVAGSLAAGRRAHLETFGGCLLGQLCPPSLLVAVSVLEALFFVQHGVRGVSLSYTQQTHPVQDVEALAALRTLASRLLPAEVDRHLTLYTYMGVFPNTEHGARRLLDTSVDLAVRGGAERLIVKTAVESRRIPTVTENVEALVAAATRARRAGTLSDLPGADQVDCSDIVSEATALVEAVLGLSDDVGEALRRAFAEGLLDVPFCLHRDNAGLVRAAIGEDGRLRWAGTGRLPLPRRSGAHGERITSRRLLSMLWHTAARYDDTPSLTGTATPTDTPTVTDTPADTSALSGAPTVPGANAVTAANAVTGTGATPYRIAVVGTGPRGLAVLERLAARLADRPPTRPVELLAIDAVEIGCGRIWRTDQPEWFLMNTPAGEVTMFSGPPDGGPARAGAGPSFGDWWCATEPARGDLYGYAPRAVYGRYLRYVFDTVAAGLPPTVRVLPILARVEDLAETLGGGLRLRTDRGDRITVDRVVLTTGHPLPDLDDTQRSLADVATRHRPAQRHSDPHRPDRERPAPHRPAAHHTDGPRAAQHRPATRYLRGDSAADMALGDLPAGSTVGVLGLGLSFYDVMAALTIGRGGTFVADGDDLRYRPSGDEPTIVAGSRAGVPLPARGRNQKHPNHRYRPRLFTAERMRRFRRAGALDFRRDVRPWLLAEVDLVYYGAVVRNRYGDSAEEAFVTRVLTAVAAHPDDPRVTVRRQAVRFGVGDVPVLDLTELARPFAGRHFAGPDEFHRAVTAHIRRDLAYAEQGNVDGPVKAALDTLRDVRSVIRVAVDYGGLTASSYRDDFLGEFVPMASTLSAGPPRDRLRQVLALIEAGVLRLLGPDSRFRPDPVTGGFRGESGQVDGASVALDALIDARIPGPDLRRDPAPLTTRLVRDGILTPFTNTSGDDMYTTGGVDVTAAPFHPVGVFGRPHRSLHVLGIPTEHTRWFTQVGSGRPGEWGEFTADADAVADGALAPLRATEATGRTPGLVSGGIAGAGEGAA